MIRQNGIEGWIFFESRYQQSDLHYLSFISDIPSDFSCNQIHVSDESLRILACTLLAYGKTVASNSHDEFEISGNKLECVITSHGVLVMLAHRTISPTKTFVAQLMATQIAPELSPQRSCETLANKTREVVKLTALGFTTAEVAKALFLSNRGVDYHLDLAKKYLGAPNKSSLIYFATQHGILN